MQGPPNSDNNPHIISGGIGIIYLDDVTASVPLAMWLASGTLALHNSDAIGDDITYFSEV